MSLHVFTRCIIGLFCLGVSFGVRAQTFETHNLETFRISGSFLAVSSKSLGVSVSIERNITANILHRYNERIENPKRRKKAVLKEFYWGSSFGRINNKSEDLTYFAAANLGYQRSSTRGSLWSAELGIGGYTSKSHSPTIVLVEDKTVEQYDNSFGLMPSLSLTWGWNEWLRKHKSWGFKIGPMGYLRTNHVNKPIASLMIVAELIVYDLF